MFRKPVENLLCLEDIKEVFYGHLKVFHVWKNCRRSFTTRRALLCLKGLLEVFSCLKDLKEVLYVQKSYGRSSMCRGGLLRLEGLFYVLKSSWDLLCLKDLKKVLYVQKSSRRSLMCRELLGGFHRLKNLLEVFGRSSIPKRPVGRLLCPEDQQEVQAIYELSTPNTNYKFICCL